MRRLKPPPDMKPRSDGSYHDPKHKYDCERCKLNWNCGFECSCLWSGLPEAPSTSKYVTTKKFDL